MLKYKSLTSPRILWAAPLCLHDTSSGAAIQTKAMFEQLAKRGIHCGVLGAFNFDAASGSEAFSKIQAQLNDNTWANFDDNSVTYSYLKTKSQKINEMTRAEEHEFFVSYLHALENFKPDVIFLYDLCTLEMAIMTEAKKRGINVVVGIFNGNYINYDFFNVDMALTDSPAAALYYREKTNINVLPTGIFIHAENVLAKKHKPQYITFINTSPHKGLSIVLRLALMAQKNHKDWQFLLVDNKNKLEQSMQIYNQEQQNFSNIEVAKHTTDMRTIFAKTKVLLAPSLWFECFCRSAAEATMNAIPVIASTSGGLPTTINGGGIAIKAPQKCHKDYNYFPTEDEITEWFKALEDMMDEKNYTTWSKKALEASKIHNIEASTQRTLNYLAPLFAKKPSFDAHFLKGKFKNT